MISWLTWPVELLAKLLAGGRGEQIQKDLGDERYVAVKEWAMLKHISPKAAEEELDRGVKAGVLQKMFLYEDDEASINFLVPQNRLNTPLRLSEVGYFGEGEDREIVVPRARTRVVYVSTAGEAKAEAEGYAHAT